MLTLDLAAPTRSDSATTPAEVLAALHPSLVLVPLRGNLWRVTNTSGEVLGYVEQLETDQGLRYRAKRVSLRLRRFVSLGEFWRMTEAVDCFVAG